MKKLAVLLLITMFLVPVVLGMPEHLKVKEPLERITFIHYRDGRIKPEGKARGASLCYKLMGIKWKSFPITYTIHTDLDVNAITAAVSEWDSHTSTNLFGSYSIDSSANFDDSPDGRNEYSYGDYPQSGVIAVTRVWYTRQSKQIVEYDVMFDTDFTWGDATVNPSVMDLQNIATHETGHGIGLADVYNTVCSEVTMYGYSDYGEIQKRTLEPPDIIGLQKLYGV